MNRRNFFQSLAVTSVIPALGAGAQESDISVSSPIPLSANESIVYESPDAAHVYAYSPGLAIAPTGRLIATMDQGGSGVKNIAGIRKDDAGKIWNGKIYTSDDRGATWQHRSDMPLKHARPFVAGKSLYIVGHAGDLGVMRSDDWGATWSEPAWLTDGESWHQAPCNVLYTRGRVYLVMETKTDREFKGWSVSVLAPVVLSAKVTDNLLEKTAWTFSNKLSFRDYIAKYGEPNLLGVPFFNPGRLAPEHKKDVRGMAPAGWLETNIVAFTDPDHIWHDPTGRTFYLWMRSHTGTSNLACIAKVTEDESGALTVDAATAPSGKAMLYVPCPGGQMKFHILYDDVTKLFWLLSSQSTDSMTDPTKLPDNRYNLPNNERHRLVLHFSKNCVDWIFAARVADTGNAGQGRHYASMVIDNDDLHILSRSGDHRAKDSHNGNLITFHTVKSFRDLVY